MKKKVVVNSDKKVIKMNSRLPILIIFAILLLAPILTIILFKYATPHTIIEELTEGCGCRECKDCKLNNQTEGLTNKEDLDFNLISDGSRLYSEDIKVTVDVPSYYFYQDIMGVNTLTKWNADTSVDYGGRYFDNYFQTLSISLNPVYTEESIGCGLGCFVESLILINTYINKENLSLELAMDKYITEFHQKANEDGIITAEIETKWGERTFHYETDDPPNYVTGYLVVKNGYIYDITFFYSSGFGDLKEPYDIALEVLDSIDLTKC